MRASAGDCTRIVRSGAWPLVPSTSSCPAWPISTIVRPSAGEPAGLHMHLGDERAGRVDHLEMPFGRSFVDRAARPRARTAPPRRPRAPRSPPRRRSRPWTRGRARRAGCGRSACGRRPASPCLASARSTASTARSTPAQYPRGAARSTVPSSRCAFVDSMQLHGSRASWSRIQPGYDLKSWFGCRMSVGSPSLVGHETGRPVRSSPARRCATTFPGLVCVCLHALGSRGSDGRRRAIGHTEIHTDHRR